AWEWRGRAESSLWKGGLLASRSEDGSAAKPIGRPVTPLRLRPAWMLSLIDMIWLCTAVIDTCDDCRAACAVVWSETDRTAPTPQRPGAAETTLAIGTLLPGAPLQV